MLIIKLFFFCLLFFFGSVLDINCSSNPTSSDSSITNSASTQVPKKLSKQGQKIEKQSHKEANSEYYRDQSPHTRRLANQRTVAREAIRKQGIHKAKIGDAEYRMEELKNHPKTIQYEQKIRKARAIKGEKKESKKVENVIRDTDFHVAKGTLTHEDGQNINQAIRHARTLATLN